MPKCKKCGAEDVVKSGTVRKKQRYLCKACGCHFVEGDDRRSEAEIARAVTELLDILGVENNSKIGEHLGYHPTQISRWRNASKLRASTAEIRKGLHFKFSGRTAAARFLRDRAKFFREEELLVARGIVEEKFSVMVVVQKRPKKKGDPR